MSTKGPSDDRSVSTEAAQEKRLELIEKIGKFERLVMNCKDIDLVQVYMEKIQTMNAEFMDWHSYIAQDVETTIQSLNEVDSKPSPDWTPDSNASSPPNSVKLEVAREAICHVLTKRPLIPRLEFLSEYMIHTAKPLDLRALGIANLKQIGNLVEGVELSEDGSTLHYKKVQCYPFKKTGSCHCGLRCDRINRGYPPNFRVKQCENELFGKCEDETCTGLHTTSFYENDENSVSVEEKGEKSNSVSRPLSPKNGKSALNAWPQRGSNSRLRGADKAATLTKLRADSLAVIRRYPCVVAADWPKKWFEIHKAAFSALNYGFLKQKDAIRTVNEIEMFTDGSRAIYRDKKSPNCTLPSPKQIRKVPAVRTFKNMHEKVMHVFKIVPLIQEKKFPAYFNKVMPERLNIETSDFDTVPELLKSVKEIQSYEWDGNKYWRYPDIVCYPYTSSGKCECGLFCDSVDRKIQEDFRIQQCMYELGKGCSNKRCQYLHTKTVYGATNSPSQKASKSYCKFANSRQGCRNKQCRMIHVCSNCNDPAHLAKDCKKTCKFFSRGECRNGEKCMLKHTPKNA
eukprot:98812_1